MLVFLIVFGWKLFPLWIRLIELALVGITHLAWIGAVGMAAIAAILLWKKRKRAS